MSARCPRCLRNLRGHSSDAPTPFRNAIISSALHCLQSLQSMHHDELIVLVFMDPEAQPPIKTNGLIGFLT